MTGWGINQLIRKPTGGSLWTLRRVGCQWFSQPNPGIDHLDRPLPGPQDASLGQRADRAFDPRLAITTAELEPQVMSAYDLRDRRADGDNGLSGGSHLNDTIPDQRVAGRKGRGEQAGFVHERM